MSIQRNSSNINKTFIIGDQGSGTGQCQTEYINFIEPCTGDTVQIGPNLLVRDSLSATTLYGDGSNLTGIVTNHNGLTGLQGGTSNQYYHLTQAEYSAISGSGSDNRYVNVTGDTMTGTLYVPTLSATTVSGATFLSGGTDLLTIIDSRDNYTTGSTLINKTIYFNTIDSLSAYTSNLDVFITTTEANSSFVNTSGDTMTGGLVTPSLSATSITGSSLYSGSTNLLDIFDIDGSRWEPDTNNINYNKGNLYNQYAVDTGKLAPIGWRVPTYNDNQTLATTLSGASVAGGALKTVTIDVNNLKGWSSPNTGAINSVNFDMIPSGYRHYSNGQFYRGLIDGYGYWRDSAGGMVYVLYNSAALGFAGIQATGGIPVRCMRDATLSEQALTDGTYLEDVQDYDGNCYKSVKIGTQVWLNNNLKTTHYNDGSQIPNLTGNTDWANDTLGAYCTYNNVPLSTYEDATYYFLIDSTTLIRPKNTKKVNVRHIDGLDVLFLSGGTVTGGTVFNSLTATTISATTISATTLYGNGANITGIDHNTVVTGLQGGTSGQYYHLTQSQYDIVTASTGNYWTSGSTGNYSVKVINDSGLDATGNYAIAIGLGTTAGGDYSHAGGVISSVNGSASFVHGIYHTIDTSSSAAIIGGFSGTASNANFSFIGGGYENIIGATNGAILGGQSNILRYGADRSVILGGTYHNLDNGSYDSIIAGGSYNNITNGSQESFILGGFYNNITNGSQESFILGGFYNTITNSGYRSAIILSSGSTMTNGANNNIIIGGTNHLIQNSANYNIIFGGDNNEISSSASYANILVSRDNLINNSSNYSLILGSSANTITNGSEKSIILGGENNKIGIEDGNDTNNSILLSLNSTIVGSNYSIIIGGENNMVSGSSSNRIDKAIIIGVDNYTATTGNTVYVPKLNINDINNGAIQHSLGIDSNGFVVTGNTSIPSPWEYGSGYSSSQLIDSLSVASGDYSIAGGYNVSATTDATHAEGYKTLASGKYSHAEGDRSMATNESTHAEGQQTTASGQYSHTEGYQTTAGGVSSHSEGWESKSYTEYSHAEGYRTIASGTSAHAEGYYTTANGVYSHSEGYQTIASGYASHSEGYENTASGYASHSEGYANTASGDYSHTEGQINIGSGNYSHTEGTLNISSGLASHAEGASNTASGSHSHAEGNATTASATYSHAEGYQTIASGNTSHAEGSTTIAGGAYSHAGGYNSITLSDNSFIHSNSSIIRSNSTNSVILGGNNNLILNNIVNSVILGCHDITATTSNTVYGCILDFDTVSATTLYGDGSNITNINPSSVTGFVHLSGDTMTGQLNVPTLSANTIDVSNQIINSYTGDVLINDNLKITGDLVVLGSVITANTEQLLIKDNTLTLNYGETGGTVTKGVAGLEVDRGTGATYAILFVESSQTFNVGISGNTQPVATREDTPLNQGIAYWNNAQSRFDTTLNLTANTISATTISGTTLYGDGSNITGIIMPPAYWTSGSSGSYSVKANNDSGLDAIGDYALAEGYGTIAQGNYSHAEGSTTTAAGASSHAEGNFTTALGDNSHAEGNYTIAQGNFSHAEGDTTISIGLFSHAEGNYTTAQGDYSHVEGGYTTANGQYSHAEGSYTIAQGDYSHAEGNLTTANGISSHAEGDFTTANGNYSHAEGSGTTASGNYSHVGGYGSSSSPEGSFIHSQNSTILKESNNSAILGGFNNIINQNVVNSVILGCHDITATTSNTVYGCAANFNGITATTISGGTLYGDGSNLTNLPTQGNGTFVHLSGDTMTGGLVTPSLSATSITANTGFIGNYLDFRTGTTDPTPVSGRVYFDESENALSYYPKTPNMDVTVNIAQEGLIEIYNNTGSLIRNGQAVHVMGAYSGGTNPTAVLAIASGSTDINNTISQVSGIATHDIPDGANGFITKYGKVRDLNITGVTQGSDIYLSDTIPGDFVYLLSNLSIDSRVSRIGHVVKTGVTDGVILVEIHNEPILTQISARRNEIINQNAASTGLITGGTLSLSAVTGSTTFNLSSGRGYIANNSNPDSPTFTIVTWSASTGVSATYISDTGETHTLITINSSGNIIQTRGSVGLTAQQKRQQIEIGGILHIGGQILYAWERSIPLTNPINQLEDLTTSIGPFSVSGNRVSKITGTLKLQKSLGEAFYFGGNYTLYPESPNILTTDILSGSTFVYASGTKILGPSGTTIDTTNYDPSGAGVIIPLDNNQFTAHRIWHQPTENVLVFQYGQSQFGTLSEARADFASENYITPPVLPKECYLIAVILVKKGITNLDTSTTSLIISQGKFAGTGGGGTTPDTLQSAYDNSVSPEIITDSTRGPVDFKIGSGSDSDRLVTYQDSSSNVNAYIIGTGGGIFNSLTATTLSGTGTRDVKVNSNGALIASTDKQTSSNITGTTVLDTFADTDADACVWDYVVKSSGGMRAGTITGIWSASTDVAEYYEISSNDIGNTEGVTLNVDISSNNVRLNVSVTGGTWTIKTNRTQL